MNDESPEFQFRVYKSQIDENSAVGSSVLEVNAVDGDVKNLVKFCFKLF